MHYVKAGGRYVNMDAVAYVSEDDGGTVTLHFLATRPETKNPHAGQLASLTVKDTEAEAVIATAVNSRLHC